MDEELWINYTEGDEVRWTINGHIVTVMEIDEDNQLVTIEDDYQKYKVPMGELE